ncbi:hypothetical protein J2852_006302 [Azospirillum soli]|nr:hypothetical protein [Azospirillum soli]
MTAPSFRTNEVLMEVEFGIDGPLERILWVVPAINGIVLFRLRDRLA